METKVLDLDSALYGATPPLGAPCGCPASASERRGRQRQARCELQKELEYPKLETVGLRAKLEAAQAATALCLARPLEQRLCGIEVLLQRIAFKIHVPTDLCIVPFTVASHLSGCEATPSTCMPVDGQSDFEMVYDDLSDVDPADCQDGALSKSLFAATPSPSEAELFDIGTDSELDAPLSDTKSHCTSVESELSEVMRSAAEADVAAPLSLSAALDVASEAPSPVPVTGLPDAAPAPPQDTPSCPLPAPPLPGAVTAKVTPSEPRPPAMPAEPSAPAPMVPKSHRSVPRADGLLAVQKYCAEAEAWLKDTHKDPFFARIVKSYIFKLLQRVLRRGGDEALMYAPNEVRFLAIIIAGDIRLPSFNERDLRELREAHENGNLELLGTYVATLAP